MICYLELQTINRIERHIKNFRARDASMNEGCGALSFEVNRSVQESLRYPHHSVPLAVYVL